MRRLECGEFRDHKCGDCFLCGIVSEKLCEGTCPYEVCPFHGKWKRKRRKYTRTNKVYASVSSANNEEQIRSLSRGGMTTTEIAERFGIRPQVAADIIKRG